MCAFYRFIYLGYIGNNEILLTVFWHSGYQYELIWFQKTLLLLSECIIYFTYCLIIILNALIVCVYTAIYLNWNSIWNQKLAQVRHHWWEQTLSKKVSERGHRSSSDGFERWNRRSIDTLAAAYANTTTYMN